MHTIPATSKSELLISMSYVFGVEIQGNLLTTIRLRYGEKLILFFD